VDREPHGDLGWAQQRRSAGRRRPLPPFSRQWSALDCPGLPPRVPRRKRWTGSTLVVWAAKGLPAALGTARGFYSRRTAFRSNAPSSMGQRAGARHGHSTVWTGSSPDLGGTDAAGVYSRAVQRTTGDDSGRCYLRRRSVCPERSFRPCGQGSRCSCSVETTAAGESASSHAMTRRDIGGAP